ncbi:hypothetical protein Ahy_B06g083736 [Arachis hypogaea]|uniref:Aminotransferase-like plant mobile domain-containing protein n=1 Tax=Arachis hypogaea TaxID=3818 RepID=A0A444YQK8_ARAHY|nr:hypothetical protein Ahy_B06g083736 [Arachis hypogaea]
MDMGVRDRIVLNDDVHMQMYVKCHIMLLFGKILFADKSGATFSWGSACLAHLYRSLCRATRVDCKEMDGPLTLLVSWAWIRLPFLAPIPGNPRVFPIANRWHNWDRQNYAYRYKTLAHYRRLLDDLQEGQNQDWANTHSRWVMQWTNRYSHILSEDLEHLHYPLEIYMHWYRDAYGDPLQLSNLVFEENPEGPPPPPPAPEPEPEPAAVPPPPPPPEPPQQGVEYFAPYVPNTHPSDYYSVPVPSHQQFWGGPHFEYGEQPSFNQLLGFMASGSHHTYSGNYVDIPTDHQAHLGGITPARRSFDLRSRVRTSSDNSGVRMSVDSSRSTEAAGGIIQSGNPRRIPITLPHEETDNYLVDHPEDEAEDEDEDDDEDEDEDEEEDEGDDEDDDAANEDPAPSAGTATSEKGKGYNLRADPPRRSANRYTPSAFNRIAKKCRKLYKDMRWAPRNHNHSHILYIWHRMSSIPTHIPDSPHLSGWYNLSLP